MDHSSSSSTGSTITSSAYRQSDSYGQSKDAYAGGSSAYENSNNPYERRSEEKESLFFPCRFWFILKVKMQELFSSDVGLQKEERIITSDTDMFKIDLFVRIQSRSMSNLFVIPLIVMLVFIVMVKTNIEFTLVLVLFKVALILWVLFCPSHQTYSAGAFALHKNSQALYRNWRKQFNFYQTMTILGYFIGTVFIAGLAFFPEVYNYFIIFFEGVVRAIPLFSSFYIEQVSVNFMQETVLVITLTNAITIFLYFMYISYIAEEAKKMRIAYRKTNVDDRTLSHFAKKRRVLDGI